MTHDVDFACASLSPSVLQSRRPEGGPVALRRNRPHPRAASNVPSRDFQGASGNARELANCDMSGSARTRLAY